MKKHGPATAALAVALIAAGLVACARENRRADDGRSGHERAIVEAYHNSRNSLTWWGAYEGAIPLADGGVVDVRIRLNRDYTFEMRREYAGGENGVFVTGGTFRWDDAGRNVALDVREGDALRGPGLYQVGESFLLKLDAEGNPAAEAESHRLQKTAQ